MNRDGQGARRLTVSSGSDWSGGDLRGHFVPITEFGLSFGIFKARHVFESEIDLGRSWPVRGGQVGLVYRLGADFWRHGQSGQVVG